MTALSGALPNFLGAVSTLKVGKQRIFMGLVVVGTVFIMLCSIHLFNSGESNRSLDSRSSVELISSSKRRSRLDPRRQPDNAWHNNRETVKLLLRQRSNDFVDEGGDGHRSFSKVLEHSNSVNHKNGKESQVQGGDEDGFHQHQNENSRIKTSDQRSCHPSHSVAMVKTHKCSSSTVQNILLRHAENHNLSVAVPKSGVYFTSWGPLKRKDIFMDNGHRKYNIMASHMRFHEESRKVIEDVMASDTKFITILRNPAEQYESMYTYFGWKNRFQVDLQTFLRNPEKYFFREPSVALYAGRNPMCYDNGLDARMLEDGAPEVFSLISKMANWFDLVLISEFLDESLILLKDLMCWSFEDVVFFSQNARHKDSVIQLPKKMKDAAMKWNWADTLLYRFFNNSLWQKIEAYGMERISEDLAQLQSIKADLTGDCIERTLSYGDRRIYYPGGMKVKSYQISPDAKHQHLCEQMTMPEIEYLKLMRVTQAEQVVNVGRTVHLKGGAGTQSGERRKLTASIKLETASGAKTKEINESSSLSKKVLIPEKAVKDSYKSAINMTGQVAVMSALHSTATCQPLDNVVMIKTHKCSSSTLQNIFLRRAEDRSLKVALPRDGVYFNNKQGYIYAFQRTFIFMDDGTEKYNIMASHMKLKVEKFSAIRNVMASGTKYIGIFRNPADQFESMYTYYVWKERFQADLHTFLRNPDKYFTWEPSFTVQAGRNPMCYDNGLDARNLRPGDSTVTRFIATLDEWFDLVLIADYFDESLILLKELMCWSYSDIAYLKQNARSQESLDALSPTEKELVLKWNWADTMLYQYFNTTLWKKIDAYGREKMEREVVEFQKRNRDLAEDCVGKTLHQGDHRVWYPPGIKVDSFQMNPSAKDPHLCSQMTRPELNYLSVLREKQLNSW